jgi:hypothetical protein
MLAFGIVALCLLGVLATINIYLLVATIIDREEASSVFVVSSILLVLITAIAYISLTLGEL